MTIIYIIKFSYYNKFKEFLKFAMYSSIIYTINKVILQCENQKFLNYDTNKKQSI